MLIKVIITRKKDGSFKGEEGSTIPYFWYNADRLSDGVSFQFGSKDGSYEKGDELELELTKTENSRGRLTWKEVAPLGGDDDE